MSSIDRMIEQQAAAGRPMDCSFVLLAQEYKAIHDAKNNDAQRAKVEADFRAALMLLPEFTPALSRAILYYVFSNPDKYTESQKTLIIKEHIEYQLANITPETKVSVFAYLESLLPTKKKAGKLENYPALKALVESKLNEGI